MKKSGRRQVLISKIVSAFLAWIAGSAASLAELPIEVRAAAGSILTLGGTGDYNSSVSNFVAAEGSRITLAGKRGAKFVVNVSGDFEMSGAMLTFEGGLLPADVMFNLNSTASGVQRRIVGNSEFFGCIVANGTPLTISNSTINGRKISGPIERTIIAPLRPPPRPRGPVGP